MRVPMSWLREYADLAPEVQSLLDAGAPLVQERMTLLGEAPGMLGFLFVDEVEYAADALKGLPANAADVLAACIEALEPVPEPGGASSWRPRALRIPRETEDSRPKGLPMAISQSPIRVWSESAQVMYSMGSEGCTRSRATSVSASLPAISAS